jgi:hypothetical protein
MIEAWRTHSCVQRSHSCERDMCNRFLSEPQYATTGMPGCYDGPGRVGVLNHSGGVAIWPGIARQIASVPGENQSLARRKSRLKGGCSQDWLPHKACETAGPQNG